ncbi:murein DD-endopeptidase MepM/ murein hydrolase activator NlpD [Kribbella voronezhensis]|uniref:Murein DD-endopeptidase MepM/ murein hydrolase activator NlpD n=1 Tax=Kribbella voronezhensis TaxID=2512212 RepID=A0A4R7T0B8_9ACTN|nr:peptidoglycan DD-metalloendopeptidase family protein [Kribbella voronezhensis]TDU84277.1 murein DD-endopeptidase MepM/ murein hydrolase activator NlpD [Kribbella voronezhensis]
MLGNRRRLRLAVIGALVAVVALPSYAAYADDPTPPPPASVTDVKRSLEQLQAEAAAIQADFAKTTIAYTNALKAVQTTEAAAKKAEQYAAGKKSVSDVERRKLGLVTAQAYQLGIPTVIGTESMLWSLAPIAENLQEIADRQAAIRQLGSTQVSQYQAATAAQNAAGTAADDAARKRAAADQAAQTARTLGLEVKSKAAEASVAMQDQMADLAGASQMSSQLQNSRNAAAFAKWQAYLTDLAATKVIPPAAGTMRNPAKLPAGLKPYVAAGHNVPGAASVVSGGRTVRVLSAETIRAVNQAFSLLGKPYGVGATGPDKFGCLGAARVAWQPYAKLPNLISKVYPNYQKVPTASIQPGDLLLIGNRSIGLFHIGVALDGNEMIAADEAKGSVTVTNVPDNLYAALRPTLGQPTKPQRPPASTTQAYQFRCGNTATSYDVGTGAWTWPISEGQYEIGTPFGQAGPLWASGFHTGQDFVAPVGTTVRAVTAGTVRIEHPAWAGNLVRIDHGNGLETLYAHLSTITVADGAHVVAGQQIGAVGTEGNSTGPHLHFEVHLGGDTVNPMPFLATGSTSTGWGGYSNGMIPADKLCGISGGSGHMLRCDAAAAYQQLASAYKGQFGKTLCITDSYRSYASQVDLYGRKPSLAALPGTSNHGWGVAVDLCGGIDHFGTAQYQWMLSHAPAFGWVHPSWANQGGGREEPWHWEFGKPANA